MSVCACNPDTYRFQVQTDPTDPRSLIPAVDQGVSAVSPAARWLFLTRVCVKLLKTRLWIIQKVGQCFWKEVLRFASASAFWLRPPSMPADARHAAPSAPLPPPPLLKLSAAWGTGTMSPAHVPNWKRLVLTLLG